MSQAEKAIPETERTTSKDMKDIVALCKRRGFVFPASDIYGGINGFWDYGPLGVELKNNLRDLWWKHMVITPPVGPDGAPVEIVGLDSAIIQNPKTWVASGHAANFTDPRIDCKETKGRYRADHLIVFKPKDNNGIWFLFDKETGSGAIEKRIKKFGRGKTLNDFEETGLPQPADVDYALLLGPDASKPGTLTEPRAFNMMFETFANAVSGEDSKVWLRPETAQGIFLNFRNVVDSSRVRVPFGIAQIGKAFRNEVTPRNFIFRSREFEQMEMEWFCHPSEVRKWRDFWFEQRKAFWTSIGLTSDHVRMRDHDKDELSHYAREGLGTADIEYRFPFTDPDYGELEGIAHRCDFDLTQHQKESGVKMEYTDPVTNEKFMPHVIEPAAGLTRGVLALLCEAYTPDSNRPSGVYLNFHPSVAPKKAAILPLTAKPEHVPLATQLYMDIREHFNVDLDIKQNIGKRYARQDEIGTPFCFTIDNQSVDDKTVTVRHRNTMKQDRIGMDHVADYMRRNMMTATGR